MLFIYEKSSNIIHCTEMDVNSIIYFLLVLFWVVPLEAGSGTMSNPRWSFMF